MSKVFSLIKYSIINSISKEKNKPIKKRISTVLLGSIVGIMLFAMASIIFYQSISQIIQMNLPPELFLVSIITIITGVIIFFDVIRAPGVIFNVKDFQLLATIPVSSGKIILAKMLELLLSNYLITIAIMIPAYGIYFYKIGFNLYLFLLLGISMLFVPLIPTSIGILIGYFFYSISSKFKYKEIAITIAYLVGVLLLMVVIYGAPIYMPYILENATYIIDILSKLYLPFEFYIKFIMLGSAINLVYFSVISVVIFMLLAFVIKNTFFKLNSKFIVYGKSKDLEFKDGIKQTKIISLLKTELIKYFSKGIVVVNTGISGVMYNLFIVLAGLKILDLAHLSGGYTMLILGCFVFSMSPTTATTISLEGKAFNMKKSLPIKPSEIIISKILVNILVNTPFILLGMLLEIILLKQNIMIALINCCIIFIALLAGTIFGMVINLNFYTFSWTSEAQVVKRGMSVMITMIPSMIIMFVLMGIQVASINIGIIALIIYGGILLISSFILIKFGEVWYSKIEC